MWAPLLVRAEKVDTPDHSPLRMEPWTVRRAVSAAEALRTAVPPDPAATQRTLTHTGGGARIVKSPGGVASPPKSTKNTASSSGRNPAVATTTTVNLVALVVRRQGPTRRHMPISTARNCV
jgi:hypothetical protein